MKSNRTRSSAIAALAVAAIFSQGCATLLKGTTEDVMVNSDPTGAQVSVNDQMTGVTPYVVKAKSNEDLHIHVSKAGYQPQEIDDNSSFRWGWETWSFFSWVIPLGVDMADGAAWGHDQTMIAAHLEPNAQSAPATASEATMPQADTASAAPAAVASPTAPVVPIAAAAPPIPAPPVVAPQQPAAARMPGAAQQ